jgi:hypothetical protein
LKALIGRGRKRAFFLSCIIVACAAGGRVNAAVLGDVTGDGKVQVSDAVKLLRFAVQTELPSGVQAILGDVYPYPGANGRRIGDQRINVQDAIQVLRYSVGLITPEAFGANERFIALSPRQANAGPLDQIQFVAVPVNIEGAVEWFLTSNALRPGLLSVDFTATVHARVGSDEATAVVTVSEEGPPPPPPIG